MNYRYELKRYTDTDEGAELRQWYTVERESDCLNVRIMGQITSFGIDELLAQFASVTSCRLKLWNVKGSHGPSKDLLGEILESLGRENVTTSVRGFCRSGGIMLLCWSGFVSAASDAEFAIHAPFHNFTRESETCNYTLGEVIDRSFDKRYDRMVAVLRKRLTNPERFLDGRDHFLDANLAKMIGLIDEVTS